MSVILEKFEWANPSLVFFDSGSWKKLSAPAYGEKVPSGSLPMADLGGGGERESGLEPESGLPDSIHDSRSSISWTSERRFWTLNFLDFGLLIVPAIDLGLGLGF